MAKYDLGYKMTVVKAYLAGEGGYRTLAVNFGIASYSTVRKWVKIYEALGEPGLDRRISHKTYSVQFKMNALNYKLSSGESYQNVALKFG